MGNISSTARHALGGVFLSVSIPEALVTFFLPEDLGTYLVVGEGEGAGERGSRAIWAPRKMKLEQHRSQSKAGRERENVKPPGVCGGSQHSCQTHWYLLLAGPRRGTWEQGKVAA